MIMGMFFSMSLFAQPKGMKQFSVDIPPFKMLLSNGRFYSAKDLQKNKPVIIIYFSPDCDHCQVLMNDLFKNINEFKNTELIMVTFRTLGDVINFEKSYQTTKYPNIKVGTEGNTFFLRKYNGILNTPFTAIYKKQGKIVGSYRNTTPVDDLIALVRKI